MKILHVVDQISQRTAGGSAVVPFQLSQAQAKLGHDVTIYTSDFNAKTQDAPEGVKLVKFHTLVNILGSIRITPGILTAKFNQFDIIHLHNYRTFQNLIWTDINPPILIQAHGNSRQIGKGLTVPLHNLVWRNMIIKHAARCIADSNQEVANYINEGVKPDKIVELPIGINLTEFDNLPNRQSHDGKQILFLGRIDYNKGLDLLINALGLLTDVHLKVVGVDYGFEAEARQMVADLGLQFRVEFTGPLYGKDKIQAYVDADLFVMPSRSEMWGLTFMEALACGTPVLLTDTCAAARVIQYPLGEVCGLDYYALAAKISHMLNRNYQSDNKEKRRFWIRQYSWDCLAPLYLKLYREVLRERILYVT